MTDIPDRPDFERLECALDHHHPAEMHGLLCGMLCVDGGLSNDLWLSRLQQELPDDEPLSPPAQRLLREIYKVTFSQLQDDCLSFTLLLPADDDPLSLRAESMSRWCQGYLAGLALGGLDRNRTLSADVQEFLRDVADISRLGFSAEDDTEESEVAYAEIIEYLRMGVLLVSAELAPPAPHYRH